MGIKLSAVQAALLIGRNERRIRDWIATQRLPATKAGHVWQIDTEDLARVPGVKIDHEQLALLQTQKLGTPQGLLHRIAQLEHIIQDLHADMSLLNARLTKVEHAQATSANNTLQTREPSQVPYYAEHNSASYQPPDDSANRHENLVNSYSEQDSAALPPDSIRMKQFALLHKVHAAVLTYQSETGKIEDTTVSAVNGRKSHWLTPQQQQEVITFWRRNGTPFVPCPFCPHTVS